jgi:hypothetical protein
MEFFYLVLGLTMFYSWIHFAFLTFKKTYAKRTTYEKVVTWYAIIMLALYIIGTLS